MAYGYGRKTQTDLAAVPVATPACNLYLRPLGTGDFAKMSIQQSRTQRLQLLRKEILHHNRLNCDMNQLRITE
jgi:hypothetical protein